MLDCCRAPPRHTLICDDAAAAYAGAIFRARVLFFALYAVDMPCRMLTRHERATFFCHAALRDIQRDDVCCHEERHVAPLRHITRC